MRVPTDKTSASARPGPGVHAGPTDANQTSLACLTTYAPATVLLCGHVYSQLGRLARHVQALEERLDGFGQIVEQLHRRSHKHMTLLAACQRDTAAVLNHELDRHALHPAIEAIVALAEELSHLKDCARQLLDGCAGREEVGKLRAEMDLSCTVARERLANLDIERIAPAEQEKLDARVHMVCGHVATADEDLHGRIHKLVTPGIAYRGKILRQARVLVFRLKSSGGQK